MLKVLKYNKAPSLDGLMAEFNRAFSSSLMTPLLKLSQHVQSSGIMPPSWKTSFLSMILKDRKDPALPSLSCPIALLNVDVKIFSTIYADRLKHIGDFIPRDFIEGNIRRALNLTNSSNLQKLPTLLVSLDRKKAFDSVEPYYHFPYCLIWALGEVFRKLSDLSMILQQLRSALTV